MCTSESAGPSEQQPLHCITGFVNFVSLLDIKCMYPLFNGPVHSNLFCFIRVMQDAGILSHRHYSIGGFLSPRHSSNV